MKDLILILTLCSLLTLSCKKEKLDPPEKGSSVFSITGTLNNDPFSYVAGVDSVYADPFVDEQFGQRVWGFTLKGTDDITIPELEIRMGNHKAPYGNRKEDLDSSIFNGNFDYAFIVPPPGDPFQLSHVAVNYIDTFGLVYTSVFLDQSGGNFIVNGTTDVARDGNTYKQVDIIFNCLLYNDVFDDTLALTNGRGKILFGF